MVDPISELKTRAEILHKVVKTDPDARARMRCLREFAKADDATLEAAAKEMRHKHCLAIVAREHGFSSWEHCVRVIEGDTEDDFGTLMYGATGSTLNIWFATYLEARTLFDQIRSAGEERYLLAYKKQFLIVDKYFIEGLGFDPKDDDWTKIDFDWARPRDKSARQRLYGRRIESMRITA
jgi:hypothetical protein